jgi:hypothetical protein
MVVITNFDRNGKKYTILENEVEKYNIYFEKHSSDWINYVYDGKHSKHHEVLLAIEEIPYLMQVLFDIYCEYRPEAP